MKQFICLIVIAFPLAAQSQKNDLAVKELQVEYKISPDATGIDVTAPRLSWKIQTTVPITTQTAYEIRTAHSTGDLTKNRNLTWHTGKILSSQSIQVPYAGNELQSFEKVYWQVRVWDNHHRISDWSIPACWEMGILDSSEWKAQWISPDLEESALTSQPCPYLRKEFTVDEPVAHARLYISSHGLYQAEINGKKVGDQELTPGWTSYHHRIQYQTYDITSTLNAQSNAIGIVLGDGWYRGYLGWGNQRNVYGKKLAVIAMIRIQYQDGTVKAVITDDSWKSSAGPILKSDIYNGECYDARLEFARWSQADFNDTEWKRSVIKEFSKGVLVAPPGPPVRRIQEISPKTITPVGNKTYLVDMGQNMVGWVRMKAKGKAGDTVILKHAEVLNKDGSIYTDNLRLAQQTDIYILSGKGEEVFEPHFTFHGFRYVEITGYPGVLNPENITGIVVHSDMEVTGGFSCSDSQINQLQHNILWGQKGNFVDVPTDCPQRDERLGWTGDAQVFAPTACFNMNTASFYTKWLYDLSADQHSDGMVPYVIPEVINGGGATGWADAAVIIPWTVYLNYADTGILRVQYPSMKSWIAYMADHAGEDHIWQGNYHFGDWLSFDDNSPDYMGAFTHTDLIATAYFAFSTAIMVKVAAILGYHDDQFYFRELHASIKKAFQDEFVTPNGRLVSHTQTAYTLALAFGLLDSSVVDKAAAYLARDVESFRHITTGFLGTPLICKVLTDFGYNHLAYQLLSRREYPSWLYPVTRGATTIWERWDGIRTDSSFQDPGMNSFNHYAYGAVGKWMTEAMAGIGIDPDQPGYKHIIIHPRPGGGFSHAEAFHESPYGMIRSGWKKEGNTFIYDITIPPNTTASVYIPSYADDAIINGSPLSDFKGMKTGDDIIILLGSGVYQVKYKGRVTRDK